MLLLLLFLLPMMPLMMMLTWGNLFAIAVVSLIMGMVAFEAAYAWASATSRALGQRAPGTIFAVDLLPRAAKLTWPSVAN